MTALTNRVRNAGFVQSEANFARSREQVTFTGDTTHAGKLYAGTVVGKRTSDGKWGISALTGADGVQTALGVLLYDIDTSSGDAVGSILRRDAEVRREDLTYDASVATGGNKDTKDAQLAAAGVNIIVRQMGGVQTS